VKSKKPVLSIEDLPTLVKRKCKICDGDFTVKRSVLKHQKADYCSRLCYAKARSRKVKRHCIQCGNEFYTRVRKVLKGQVGVFCSHKCQGEHAKLKRKSHTCKYCEKTFQTHAYRKNVSYCSNSCRNSARKTRTKLVNCSYCGRLFEFILKREVVGQESYFCDRVCSDLAKAKRFISQTVYTPEFLRLLSEYRGIKCPFLGCGKQVSKNPKCMWHACSYHTGLVTRCLRNRARWRQKYLEDHDLGV